MAFYSLAIRWLFPTAAENMNYIYGEREAEGVRAGVCASVPHWRTWWHLVTAPALGAGGTTWLEKSMQGQRGHAELPGGTSADTSWG